MKKCRACEQEKPLGQFHRDRSKADGLNFYCKPCTIERQRRFMVRPPKRPDVGGMRMCQRCKTLKLLAEYSAKAGTHDGKSRRCRQCDREMHEQWRVSNLDKAAALQKKGRLRDPERYKEYQRKHNYGLQRGEFDAMLAAQEGACAICETISPGGRGNSFHVDHNHETGAVRKLLCHNCNVGLGNFKSSKRLLEAAINYLQQSVSPP